MKGEEIGKAYNYFLRVVSSCKTVEQLELCVYWFERFMPVFKVRYGVSNVLYSSLYNAGIEFMYQHKLIAEYEERPSI